MLSNTAVPKYYGAFREAVLRGDFPVCETISLEMNRIDELIRNPRFYYDNEPVEGWIRFCENELTLTDGSPLHLTDAFKLWGESIFGWYTFVERSVYVHDPVTRRGRYIKKRFKQRLINKQYLIVARGNAKTLYGETIQAYGLTMDVSTTHQVTTAPTMKQAEEIITPFKTAIVKSRGPLFQFLTEGDVRNTRGSRTNRAKLCSTKKGIENFMTNSILEVRPMRIDKLQGLQNKYSTVDEWLSTDIREDVVGALEQGASKLEDYIIVAMSSEGTVRNGAGDSIKIELMKILKGEYVAPNVSIWWYKLDDIKELNNPEMWIKANPNLGITVQFDVLQRDLERAENSPSARNDTIAKRFGIPMEGFTYFFTYQETLKHRKKRSYWKMPCSMGIDLSRGDDFCAFTFLFPLTHGEFGIKAMAYITERTLFSLKSAAREKYNEFIQEGTLIVMPGTILDMNEVYEEINKHIDDNQYDVRAVGYDPYNAKDFVERWAKEYGTFGVEKVIQGAKTETVPLGEIKAMAEDRLLLFDEEIMQFSMGNCVVLEDTNGNRKLYKLRREQKIDNVSAMMDAYVAWKLHREDF